MARPIQTRPDIQVFAEIAAVDQLVTRAMERVLPAGLSRAQFNLLNHVGMAGEQSPGVLADHFALTKGAITHLLGRLEKEGLVKVTVVAADQRRKRVGLTAAGVLLLAQAQTALRQLSANLRSALSEDGFSQTLPLLSRLRQHLSNAI